MQPEQQGNLPKSLELGFKALQVAEEHHLESFAGAALYGITEAYILLKDYSKALGYVRTRISIVEPTNEEGLAYAYFHMGTAFEGMNQLDSALFMKKRPLKLFTSITTRSHWFIKPLGI